MKESSKKEPIEIIDIEEWKRKAPERKQKVQRILDLFDMEKLSRRRPKNKRHIKNRRLSSANGSPKKKPPSW